MNPLTLMNPVTVVKAAVGLAGTAVGVVESAVSGAARTARWGLQRLAGPDHSVDDPADFPVTTDVMDAPQAEEPIVVPFEPHAPDEPPIDVVGQALAAEAALEEGQSPAGAGFAHEPRAASRAEQHGAAPLQRIEREEMEDEVTAAFEDDLEDGDAGEDHLTQPLLEPGDVKALITETAMSSRAADPDKG